MSSWLDQFQAHLDDIKASRQGYLAPTSAKSSQDIAWDILRMRIPDSAPYKFDGKAAGSGGGIGGALSAAGHGALSGGQRVLDVLSRGMYASANLADYNVTQVGPHSSEMSAWDVLKGDANAAWQGLSGHKKTSYSDVLDHAGVENGVAKGVLGFAGDVLLDPTTYIGVGAVKGLVRGGAALAGKEIPKFARAKNAFGTATVLTETEKAAADLAESGTAKVHESNVNRILEAAKKNQPKALPYRVVPESRALTDGRVDLGDIPHQSVPDPLDVLKPNGQLAIEGPRNKPDFVADASGNVQHQPWNTSTRKFAAQAQLTSYQKQLDDLLNAGAEKSRYAKGTKIDPLHRTVTRTTPEKYFEDVTETLPAKPTDAFIKEQIRSHVPTGQKIRLFSIGRQRTKEVPIQELHKAIVNGGKLSESLQGHLLETAAGRKPIEEVVNDIMTNVADHELFGTGETITKKIEKVRDVTTSATEKLNPAELAGWIAKHKDVLHPEDMRYILQGGSNAKNVATRIERVLAKTEQGSFKSAEELQQAIKEGRITEKGMATLRLKTGAKASVKRAADGTPESFRKASVSRYITDLQKKMEKAAAAVAKADEVPTKANVKAAKKATAEAKTAQAKVDDVIPPDTIDPSKVTRSKPNDPQIHGDIWQTPAFVENTEKLVDDVLTKGDTSAFAKPKAVVNEKQARIVEDALRNLNHEEFVKPRNKGDFPFVSNRGTKRTHQNIGEGRGRNIGGLNKFSQLTLSKKIMSGASGLIRGTSEAARPAAMYEATMPMLLAAEQRILQEGMPLILGKSATGFPLSMHDILSSLDRKFVERFFFSGPKSSLQITQMADVAEQAVRHSLGQIDDASFRQNVELLLVKDKNSPLAKMIAASDNPHLGRNLANTIVNEFKGGSGRLMRKLEANSARHSIEVGERTKALSAEAIAKFNAVVTDPKFSAGDVMEAALGTHNFVREAAAAQDIPVSPLAEHLAEQEAAAHAASTVPLPPIATAAKGAEGYKAAKTTSQTAKVSEKLSESADSEGRHLMEEMEINTLDMGVRAEFASGVGFFRAFAPHLGNEMLRPILTERLSVNQTLAKQFTSQLARVHATHSTADLSEALRFLQEGKEATTPAMQDMQMVIKELFNVNGSKYGLISRNGIQPEHLLTKFKKFGIGDTKYKLDLNDIDSSWKNWDIEDPLDFMSKFHAAVSSAVADKQLGAEISRMFGEAKPRPGWVQIHDSTGKSRLASLIDKNKFYPPDIARQMHMIDKTLEELAKPNSGNKFLRVLDSALHSYKAGVTIYRPGHHVRNLVGDMWLSSMDGVRPGAYKRATAVLATRKSQYQDFDALRALQDAYGPGGAVPKSVLTMTYKGKQVQVGAEQVYKMAFDSGVLPDYAVLEDIAFGATQQADKVAEFTKKMSPLRLIGQQGKLHKAASTASEYRDHYVRIAHFIHAMETSGTMKGATFEEALKNAAFSAGNRVRKWHPDGSDLSHVEKNVMRRGILFYSWVRKAIPLVVESAVTRPGKFMAYPKAMQNIAAANGVDLDSISNPFPLDQLFPSYIADSTQGPMGGEAGAYAGIKPGIPSSDVMDDYFTSPTQTLRTVMGGVNPLFKVPAEVASGNQLRTGTPIQDKSDYIDSQIPGANYVDKLAGGRSLSSGFTQSNHVSPTNADYQGNPTMPGGANQGLTDFINWLTGIGLTDYSRPSNIKSAQMERGGR
jgi:hypothetical protein